MSEQVTVTLNCFFSTATRQIEPSVAYQRYAAMRAWLQVNQVKHTFCWDDPGKYYPDAVVMEAESALAFRLTYNV